MRTKIIATIGPASLEEETLQAMVGAGMAVARINTAFGDTAQYELIINRLQRIKRTLPVMLDLKGEELRLRVSSPQRVAPAEEFAHHFSAGHALYLNRDVSAFLKPGQEVVIDSGLVTTEVVSVSKTAVMLKTKIGGLLSDGRHVNMPGTALPLDVLSVKDVKLIPWAKIHQVDWLAISSVANEEDIARVRRAAGPNMHIIAKIESARGVQNYEEIIQAADGVMVARGDLAVEVGYARVPIIEKRIIAACNQHGRMDIVATEMLESLITQPIPTRSDVSDIANAVLDGADYVMLSNKTAVGKYPVEAVKVMKKIIDETEKAM